VHVFQHCVYIHHISIIKRYHLTIKQVKTYMEISAYSIYFVQSQHGLEN